MATITRALTIEDFEKLPAEQVKNCELVDGELVPLSGNTFNHNVLRDRLTRTLNSPAREAGVVVSEQEYDFEGNAHAPDISFFGNPKRGLVGPNKRVQRFVPDLAIEIISQSDGFADLLGKKNRYRRCGVAEVWIISQTTHEVFVYSARGDRILSGDAELSTELIPGFRLTIGELFAGD